MSPAIANVKSGLQRIVSNAEAAARGNLRMELITFTDSIEVDVPFAVNNGSAMRSALANITAAGGGRFEPEASDEALRTAIHGLSESSRSPGQQKGSAVPFRPEAHRLVILVTDARPGGFNDNHDQRDAENAAAMADQAAAAGIRISGVFVPNHSYPNVAEARGFVALYAEVTGGYFKQAKSNGEGTAIAVETAVTLCGHTTTVCDRRVTTLLGTAGDDVMRGGKRRDVIGALGGNDKVKARAGKDRVCADDGKDEVLGGKGRDRLHGGLQGDKLVGASAEDVIYGGLGRDRLFGGGGNDTIQGGQGGDRIFGGDGRDHLLGGVGNDSIRTAGDFRDRVDCGPGRDRVVADRSDKVAADCERVHRKEAAPANR